MSVGAVGGAGGGAGAGAGGAAGIGAAGGQGVAPTPASPGDSQGTVSPQGGDQAKESGAGCPHPMPGINTQNYVSLKQSTQVQPASPQESMTDDVKKLLEMLIMLKMLEELGKQQ